jgi:hypothetical protein
LKTLEMDLAMAIRRPTVAPKEYGSTELRIIFPSV